jgi:hypothetical protein
MNNRLLRRNTLAGVTFLLAICTTFSVLADPPSIMKIFRPKQTLPDESLELKPEHGPWLILAATLPGADAKPQAVSLAREIRQQLKLPSFVMEKSTGVAPAAVKRERIRNDRNGNPVPVNLEVRYANGGQESVYVVLVGEFADLNDPRIPETLQAIRTAHPAALKDDAPDAADEAEKAASNNWLLSQYRSKLWSRNERKEKVGKMGAAFVTRNPLLPDDYFEAPKVDEFVANLNKDVEHSLLDCPGKFTVRVASFTGREVTDFGNGAQASKLPGETTDELDVAALKSHQLTAALRKKGVEAYEFHDRYGSYVMVGSFDSLGQELTSGQFQYNPGIIEVNAKWCGYRMLDSPNSATGAIRKVQTLNYLEEIPFDIEGKPMAVPRLATSNLYRGALLGNR